MSTNNNVVSDVDMGAVWQATQHFMRPAHTPADMTVEEMQAFYSADVPAKTMDAKAIAASAPAEKSVLMNPAFRNF